MSNSKNESILTVLIWIITIIISIGSGILAWNWIDPEGFLGIIGFLILWGILTKIGNFIVIGIISLFGRSN